MASLRDHHSGTTTKMLLVGDSGAGKSGALASLAGAGYNLRIMDFDNGLDVLKNLLLAGNYGTDAIDRVKFETLTEPKKIVGAKLVPKATIWQRAVKLLMNWDTESDKLGPITSWTDKEILVIDSLTMLSQAALDLVLVMNGRAGQRPQLQDWGEGQAMVESMLQMLYDEGVKCNVIVISHITYVGDDNQPQHGYPSTLGKALPPKVGRYFNSTLMAKSSGSGANTKRKIFTNTIGLVELKNTNPTKVKPEYPLETGLADYFKDVRL